MKTLKNENEELFFSDKMFSDLKLSDEILKALEKSNYKVATEIQAEVIPLVMRGADIMGTAKTGSGKSLAFLIPAVELLSRTNFSQNQGTGVIVLTPTRELAVQLYDVAKDLLMFKKKTCSIIIGGNYRKGEVKKLEKGVNLVIATPGRLLDHLKNTPDFNYKNLCMLIIDEADAILKIGFEDELKEILSILPNERQTLLFSATLNPKVENLINLSLKNPKFISVKSKFATVSNLEQGYIILEPEKKFLFLYTFIKKNLEKKIMVFLASCHEVQFYSYLLNYVDINVKSIHGDLKQQKRNTTYYEFFQSDKGILLCTDVAQRGLDFPDVDWIVQYDIPHNIDDYLHRVGRTARGANGTGKALLLLYPSEIELLRYLKSEKILLDQFEFDQDKIIDIQEKFEKLIESNISLFNLALEAYKSFLQSFKYNKILNLYNQKSLDFSKVCKSFGFKKEPIVIKSLK